MNSILIGVLALSKKGHPKQDDLKVSCNYQYVRVLIYSVHLTAKVGIQ